ncbi:zinc-dependent metalloprotease family protein [Arthrobacter koreensis]|uniref:zinc-dependent metalloprotease family protein n=1 Tax=Arthrobacter koreensis TaxID=199136 RepID=UPI00362AD21C
MKTGKLALLATLTGALVFGGLTPAGAVDREPVPLPSMSEQSPETALVSPEEGGSPSDMATVAPSPAITDPEPETSESALSPSAPVSPSPEDPDGSDDDADDGYEYVPVGEGHVVPGPDTPLITEPDGSVRSAVETEHEDVDPMLARGGAASMLGAQSRAGNIRVTLVRATIPGYGTPVDLSAARNAVASSSAYWQTMSNGRLSMSVASEKVHYSSSVSASDDYSTMMNKLARELKWVDNPYTALVVFVPTADLRSGGFGGILGGGWTVGGTSGRILMPKPSNFTDNVVTHEFGHLLGLLHANSLQCSNGRSDVAGGSNGRWADGACSSREYGDTTDLMGSAQYYHPVINSYFWEAGGFGRGNEIRKVGAVRSPQTYTLTPWGGTASNRAVKFNDPISGDAYYLELRQPVGYDAHLSWGSAGNRGVKIVKADAANSWAVNSLVIPPSTKPFQGYYNNNHAWQQGQTFTTHTGTAVRINSVSGSSASVTITPGRIPASLYFDSGAASYFGSPDDEFLSCDWNGDGIAEPVTFSRGIWQMSSGLTNNSVALRFHFGDPGDQPICGDWDGDGIDTVGVYRNGVAYLKNSNSSGMGDGVVVFGAKGDRAIVGDWNGDRYDTLGVARGEGAAKRFYLTNSNIRATTDGAFLFGNATDIPVAGDWNGDGFSTVGVKRGNAWFLTDSNIRPLATQSFRYGNPQDAPMTGEWLSGRATGVGVAR